MTLDEFKKAAEEKRAKAKDKAKVITVKTKGDRRVVLDNPYCGTRTAFGDLPDEEEEFEINAMGQEIIVDEEFVFTDSDSNRVYFAYDVENQQVRPYYDGYEGGTPLDVGEFVGAMTALMNVCQENLSPYAASDTDCVDQLNRITAAIRSFWLYVDGNGLGSFVARNNLMEMDEPYEMVGEGFSKVMVLDGNFEPINSVGGVDREYPQDDDPDMPPAKYARIGFKPPSDYAAIVDPIVPSGWVVFSGMAYPIKDNYLLTDFLVPKLDREFWWPESNKLMMPEDKIVWPEFFKQDDAALMPECCDIIDFDIVEFCKYVIGQLNSEAMLEICDETELMGLQILTPAKLYWLLLTDINFACLCYSDMQLFDITKAADYEDELPEYTSQYEDWYDVRTSIRNKIIELINYDDFIDYRPLCDKLDGFIDIAAYYACIKAHEAVEEEEDTKKNTD